MTKGIAAAIFALALAITLAAVYPITAQDDLEDRVEDLEDRVSALETQASANEASDSDDDGSGETYDVEGVFDIGDVDSPPGSSCRATNVDTLDPGTPVLVFDLDENLLGEGELGEGYVGDDGDCFIPFAVEDLPKADLYRFYINRKSLAGNHDFTFEELEENDWEIQIELQ